MTDLLSWSATILVLSTYLYLGLTGKPRPFHIANVVGGSILAPINLAAGVPAQALLSAVFGVVGAVSLWRSRNSRDAVT